MVYAHQLCTTQAVQGTRTAFPGALSRSYESSMTRSLLTRSLLAPALYSLFFSQTVVVPVCFRSLSSGQGSTATNLGTVLL